MAKVTWDELARQNQRDILTYGTQVWGKNAAKKMRLHIKAEIERLARAPFIGKVEPLLQGRCLQFRSLVIHEHYKLVYHYDEAADTPRRKSSPSTPSPTATTARPSPWSASTSRPGRRASPSPPASTSS